MNKENHSEHSSHPTDNAYLKIAAILAIITALEVAIFYVGGIPDLVFFTILIIMSVVKFAIVAMYYMHLKFDEIIFTWFFVGGLLLACCVIIALMALFDQL
jgi:cytochrome c oxidase subunit IV